MSFETILSCQELQENLTSENWVIVDCRFDLAAPEWGEEEYQQLHIPGAVYANLDKDLSGIKTLRTGRHPLPDPVDFCKSMSHLGIDSQTQVVVYDATSGSYAARLWFLLRFYGHFKVAVLDGGFSQWVKDGRAIESGSHENTPRIFTGTPNLQMIVITSDVEKIHADPDWLLIDARSPERFIGEQEPIDPVAGHITGAVNRFHGLNLGPDGLFLPKIRLRDEFTALIASFKPEKIAVYCGSGVTSCHHLVAMAVAGLPQPRLYVGSWSEWIRNSNHPIAKNN